MIIDNVRIMSVDDNQVNLLLIETFCGKLGFRVDSFTNPADALPNACEYDLIITDYMMPVMDGVEFVQHVRRADAEKPIIMVTAAGDDSSLHQRAIEAGATDFLMKPIHPGIFKARVINLLKLHKAMMMIKDKAVLLEEEVRKATSEVVEREKETLRLLGKTAEYKDPETGAHVARVANYSRLLAKAYGLNEKMQDIVYNASPFHDIGKVAIPDSIMLKPAALNDMEFDMMKEHTTIGYNILRNSKSEYLKAGGVIAFTHHEKYDGTGYPKGLSGEMIPIMGRIVAVADVLDALTSKRPYKDAWSFENAIAYIISEKGGHFDPLLVDKLTDNIDKIKEIFGSFTD